MSALQTGFNTHLMLIHGSGLNPLQIRFDRVRTIILQSELDPDKLYVYTCDLDRCRLLSYDAAKKIEYPFIFLASFRGAVLLASLCDALKKQAKETALDMEAAAEKMIFFEEATGV